MKEIKRIIKRYQNRKNYDTVSSKYVTLKDILSFHLNGDVLKIIDNKTKTDITGSTIADAVFTHGKNHPEFQKVLFNFAKVNPSVFEEKTHDGGFDA